MPIFSSQKVKVRFEVRVAPCSVGYSWVDGRTIMSALGRHTVSSLLQHKDNSSVLIEAYIYVIRLIDGGCSNNQVRLGAGKAAISR